MISYKIDQTQFGPISATFSSIGATLDSKIHNVRMVVFENAEFTVDNVQKVLSSKAIGITVIIDNRHFTPSKTWMDAYNLLGIQ